MSAVLVDTGPHRPLSGDATTAIGYLRGHRRSASACAPTSATLAPFDGRFVVHGADPVAVEGSWDGTLIVIAFPDAGRARGWYDSPAYRAILPLRTRNSRGTAILVDGVGPEHRATDVLRPAS
jgi:uncharacterized protein (DUF1330 family)